jgi:hypothetical protein
MAATASVKFRISTPYRGGTKVWSITHHVTGGSWQDQTHFNTYADAVKGEMVTGLDSRNTIVDATAYNPGSSLPVYTRTYGTAGTYSGTNPRAPLEACILIRFTTDQRTSKNHPIYLFNWIHGVQTNGTTDPDTPLGGQKAAWTTRANDLVVGFSDGTLTRKRAGPNGAVAQSGVAEDYLHVREFPR